MQVKWVHHPFYISSSTISFKFLKAVWTIQLFTSTFHSRCLQDCCNVIVCFQDNSWNINYPSY